MSAYWIGIAESRTAARKNGKSMQRVGFVMCESSIDAVRHEIEMTRTRKLELPTTHSLTVSEYEEYILSTKSKEADTD